MLLSIPFSSRSEGTSKAGDYEQLGYETTAGGARTAATAASPPIGIACLQLVPEAKPSRTQRETS